MLNLRDFIIQSESFKKFKVDDLLFVEYKCPVKDTDVVVWWDSNFFTFILSGKVVLKTPRGAYTLNAGDCAFAKKGSAIATSYFDDDFCELLVFVPDNFIKTVVQKYKLPLGTPAKEKECDTIIPLEVDDVLATYFHSLLTYFPQADPPSETLLKIKFEELIVNILSKNNHIPLKCYFGELCATTRPSIKEIMEANFSSNMSLEEFSRLCGRSLSAFKQEFKSIFNTTPGKWLQEKRLEYSRFLLETTDNSIDEICTISGFENRSHFIRVFKNKYGLPPGKFKLQEKLVEPSRNF